MKDDAFNPTDEPGQYRVYRRIPPEWNVGFEEVEFPELRDGEARHLAVVLWRSIQRSLWHG